jgi:hypothetical protein
MKLTDNQLMTVAMWFAVYENEMNPTSTEYKLMMDLAFSAGNTLSADYYWKKHNEALEYENEIDAE